VCKEAYWLNRKLTMVTLIHQCRVGVGTKAPEVEGAQIEGGKLPRETCLAKRKRKIHHFF
jgi:hypothetical protein